MNILAIDTSTKKANVAVRKDNNIISKNVLNEITHSEKLLPLIDEVLEESNLKLQEIDLLACTKGPGSFTGIRIGLSTAKALALVLKKNIYAVSTMELLAYEGFCKNTSVDKNNPAYVFSILDAKNDRVYYGLYRLSPAKNNKSKNVIIEEVITISNDLIADAINVMVDIDSPYLVVGDCVEKYENLILDYSKLKSLNIICSKNNDLLDATYIINYIDNVLKRDDSIFNYATLDAVYARKSQAERTLKNE